VNDALVTVHAKPGSKTPGVAWDGTRLVIRVRERAHEGKANEACRKALAAVLDVAPARVTLMRGQRSKDKLFAIGAMSREELHKKLGRFRG
jgi:uncharacterized protein YggU (UPF0235/DUF167 family)